MKSKGKRLKTKNDARANKKVVRTRRVPVNRKSANTSRVKTTTKNPTNNSSQVRRRPVRKRKKLMKGKIVTVLLALIIISICIAGVKLKEVKSKPTGKIQKDCKVEQRDYNNRKVFTISSKDESKTTKKTILYFHGGAYMAEMTNKHWEFVERIVNDTGAKVIIPDYPLAPKYNYEDVYNMVEPLYNEIINEVGSSYLTLMGDSAGGGLALGLLEKGVKTPNKVVLISPWLDASMSNESMKEVQKNDKNLNIYTLKLAAEAYAGKPDTSDYLISPINGDLSKLKNVTILTGTHDILNPDVYVLEQKMKQKGKSITIKTYDNASHDWIIERNCDNELVEKGYQDLLNLIK